MMLKKVILLAMLVIGFPMHGVAQTSHEVNEANNPLTPKITANLHDQ